MTEYEGEAISKKTVPYPPTESRWNKIRKKRLKNLISWE